MMLIVSSFIVNFALEREGVAQGLASWIVGLQLSPLGFQLAVNVVFLVLGTVLDGAVMLLVFVPVLLPAAKSLGIDLVHFGLVVILNFMIAQITPPYGLILFVLSALTGVPMREINREIWPFVVPLVIVLLLLIVFPAITLVAAVDVRVQGLTPAQLTSANCSLFVLLILPVEGRHPGGCLFGRGRNGVPAGPAQPAGLPGRLGHRSMGTMTCAQGACWTTGRRSRTGRQTTARGSEARSHEHRGGAPKGAGPRSQRDPDTLRKRVGPLAAAHGASQTPAPFGAPLPSLKRASNAKRLSQSPGAARRGNEKLRASCRPAPVRDRGGA